MKLRTVTTLTYTGLAVVGVALVSVISSWQIREYLDRRTARSLEMHLSLLASEFEDGTLHIDTTGAEDERLRHLAHILGLRLTAIRRDGVVIFDSEVGRDSLGTLENHGSRPEVLMARAAVLGTDRRRSKSVNEDFLYAARMVAGPALGILDSGFVRAALPLYEIKSLDAEVQAMVWLVGAFTIVVIAIVSNLFSRRITKPLLGIASAAEAIKGGDLERRISLQSPDEMAALAASINDMAETLNRDIKQLKKLERVRSEFLANVSHELRTPIFSIQGFLETLMDGAVDDPSVNRDFLEKAHRHAIRLNALLSDLIDISRIESGEMKMSFRYFAVVEFLRGVLDELKEQAAQKNIALLFEPAIGPEEKAYGDRERLKQVMINLLDNAIKYTDPGGTVTCTVGAETKAFLIEVKDTGCGIPEEHLTRIFERFYRVDRDRSREVGGTGLGLAIVKHIVEAHGGSLHVTSAVGKGSTFSFTVRR